MAFHLHLIDPQPDNTPAPILELAKAQTRLDKTRLFLRWELGKDGCPQSRWVRS